MEYPSVLFSSVAQWCLTLCDPWTAARQASLSITNSRSPPKLMSIESVMPSNHLILCRPLLLLPSIFTSIRVFSNESALHNRCPKYWSFSLSISPSNEHSGLISFRMDWFDLLADQRTLMSSPTSQSKSIHSSALSFMVQLSHPYMTTVPTYYRHPQTCSTHVWGAHRDTAALPKSPGQEHHCAPARAWYRWEVPDSHLPLCPGAGVPNPWDLIPDNLRRS